MQSFNSPFSCPSPLLPLPLSCLPFPSMTAAVGSVVMEGMPHNNRTTTLVTSLVGGASEVASHLVDLKLDLNPLDRPEMDITVKAALRPIQITYDFVRLVAGWVSLESVALLHMIP